MAAMACIGNHGLASERIGQKVLGRRPLGRPGGRSFGGRTRIVARGDAIGVDSSAKEDRRAGSGVIRLARPFQERSRRAWILSRRAIPEVQVRAWDAVDGSGIRSGPG